LDVKIAFRAADVHTAAANDLVIRAQKKVHRVAIPTQPGAVVTAQRAATHHTDLHAPSIFPFVIVIVVVIASRFAMGFAAS
jgi:hypothetical protein